MTVTARRIAIAIAASSIVAAAAVLSTHFWQSPLPKGLAGAVNDLSGELERAGAPDDAAKIRAACDHPRDACDCVALAARKGLDENLGTPTLDVLEKSEEPCKKRPPLAGMQAEALARVARFEEARYRADVVMRAVPNDMYANFALALAAFEKQSLKEAEPPARKALEAGRGAEADRLLGRIALATGNFDEARGHFLKVLAGRPNDAAAAFSAAICSANLKRYNEAREGFVRVVRIDPKHVEARIYLATMALQIGATMEAQHHIEKLAEVAPNEPRLGRLRAALSHSAPPPSASSP
jgi:tetratricopeptide (TPR) repeat protein